MTAPPRDGKDEIDEIFKLHSCCEEEYEETDPCSDADCMDGWKHDVRQLIQRRIDEAVERYRAMLLDCVLSLEAHGIVLPAKPCVSCAVSAKNARALLAAPEGEKEDSNA